MAEYSSENDSVNWLSAFVWMAIGTVIMGYYFGVQGLLMGVFAGALSIVISTVYANTRGGT